jgi:hypothetical protein
VSPSVSAGWLASCPVPGQQTMMEQGQARESGAGDSRLRSSRLLNGYGAMIPRMLSRQQYAAVNRRT